MSKEERKTTRLESDQFISYRLYDENNQICDEGMAKTKDISRSGVALENRREFEVGARVELTIALIDELIKTEALVRNINKLDDNTYLIGMEFTSISESEIEKLSKEFPQILE
jgi:c-di-GMP-binding flagellar brake protein YcgR